EELEKFSPTLAKKERWLVLNKLDLVPDDEREALVQRLVSDLGWQGKVFTITAISGEGCEEMCQQIMASVEEHESRLLDDPDYHEAQAQRDREMAYEIRRSIEHSKALRRQLADEEEFDDFDDDEDYSSRCRSRETGEGRQPMSRQSRKTRCWVVKIGSS